ncbi:DUF4118 domain-containing protein [Aquihabitans sp. McL0605]|uniref:DUF4118 domain-containing protein n=1 Tax=Aquihabitans sp. McL0605 TaxID=3415671 RepID=UPI003CF63081
MKRTWNDTEVVSAALGAMAAMVVAGLLGAVRTQISQANCALLLVLVIIAAGYSGGRRAGVATGLLAAASFDFFLVRPYGSLAIKNRDDVIATGLMLVVGLAVGQIASRGHEARAASQAGTDEVAGVYRVAGISADGADITTVIAAVEREVAQVLRLDECRFEALPPLEPLPELDPDGRVDAPYVHMGDGFVLPAQGVVIALRHGGVQRGWLVCRPAPGTVGISRDRRRTALVLADHLALALAAEPGPDARRHAVG